MNERGRHRLLGAAFLAAMAGIIVPILFDGAGVPDIAPHAYAPMPSQPMPAPVAPMATDGPEWAFVDEVRKLESEAGFGPEIDGARTKLGQPVQQEADAGSGASEQPWVIQVATFGDAENARKLEERLMADGLHAFATDVRMADGREFVRVSVGPILDVTEARRLQDELTRRFQVQAVLKRFAL